LRVGVIARQLERLADVEHKYAVGQIVELTPNVLRAAALGEYEIRQTMPAADVKSASPRYRIKSIAEIHERIVAESELLLPKGIAGDVGATPLDMQLPKVEN
jgi:hypothetical protein